jgi:uncharacterized membrane protein YeiH
MPPWIEYLACAVCAVSGVLAAVFFGGLVFVLLQHRFPHAESNRYIGMAVIVTLRLLAMRYGLRLPVFRMRGE